MFPSPTGATYYESEALEYNEPNKAITFPSPTGATYYESVFGRLCV